MGGGGLIRGGGGGLLETEDLGPGKLGYHTMLFNNIS